MRPRTFLALCLALAATHAHAQVNLKDSSDYKRFHQNALKLINKGEAAKAVEYLVDLQTRMPDDAETQFMLAAALAHAGQKDKAIAAMKKAIDLGLPAARFMAGPRELFKAIEKEPAFADLTSNAFNEPIHGPMLGDLRPDGLKVWLRTNEQDTKIVVATTAKQVIAEVNLSTLESSLGSDGAKVASIDALELKPDTDYLYWVQTGRKSTFHPFRTLPQPGAKSAFTIAFGGGAGYTPSNERIWDTIAKEKPRALLMLGDNIYSDAPEDPVMQRYCYYRRQSRPEWRRLVAATPVYAIYDDHDFAVNDSWGGPEIDTPRWKRPVWEVFRQNWANPAYGGGDRQPGCWFDFSIGDVDFIMLDCRYYRTNPKQADGSMLGPVQKAWLLDRLKKSKGTIKVLCSSVPWVFEAKGNSLDTWNGYRQERDEIFNFLAAEKIEGVVLLSADRHRSDLWKIDRPNGYAFYEFNSSRLSNLHTHGEMKEALFSYNKLPSFGLVTFDTRAEDPTVTYKIVNIDGEVVHSFTVKRSQLSHAK